MLPRGGSRREELGTVAGLSGRSGDLAAPREALIRRQLDIALDVVHQKVKSFLRVRLNEFELLRESRSRRGRVLVGLDMVAVLHLVEPVCRAAPALAIPFITVFGQRGGNGACVGTGVQIDWQQR